MRLGVTTHLLVLPMWLGPGLAGAGPLGYEQNVGQAGSNTLFLARAADYSIHLTRSGAVFLFPSSSVRMRIDAAEIRGVDCLPDVAHYLIGRRALWHTDVKKYRAVRYSGAARGMDITFTGEAGRVSWEYEFSPGAPEAQAEAVFEAATSVRVAASGDLRIRAGAESLYVHRPVGYQMVAGERQLAEAAYEVIGPNRVRIRSTWPDRSRPLIIDPVLSRVSMIGGKGESTIYGVAADPKGGAYLAGETRSSEIPGAIGKAPTGANTQILLTKVNASGEVVYTVLAGGSGDDVAYGVSVGKSGEVYLTGRTSSLDFPVTHGAQQLHKGGSWDAFFLALSADGKTVRAASYLGGSGEDKGQTIAVDRVGAVYIAGSTMSEDFSATGTRRGTSDAFVAKLDAKTARCRYVTLLGGQFEDYANALAVDTAGNLWVAGQTNSGDFPVSRNSLQREKHGLWNAFVARLDSASGGLRYATFLGGGGDNARSIAVEAQGSVWLAGETEAADFPVTEGKSAGGRRGFVARLEDGGTKIGYAAYLGGSGFSTARALILDAGRVVVSGTTWSRDFPPAIELATEGTGGGGDVFTVVLDRSSGSVVCGARIGGSGEDRDGGVAILADGAILVGGSVDTRGFFAILHCGGR